MRVLILTGSFKGRASRIGDLLMTIFQQLGAAAERVNMDNVDESEIDRCDGIIICTSTFHNGSAPPNAQSFLQRLSHSWPALAGKSVGVVGLGDSSFQRTYNTASEAFESALQFNGAVAPVERLLLDTVSTTPYDSDLQEWAARWYKAVSLLIDEH